MTPLPDLNHLSHAEKDALIRALWVQVEALTAQVAELEARLGEPAKTSGNSILPPARDQKANRADKPKRAGPRQGSPGRNANCGRPPPGARSPAGSAPIGDLTCSSDSVPSSEPPRGGASTPVRPSE